LASLPLGLVEQDAGGDGGVEAFHFGGVGDEDGLVGGVKQGARDSVAFAADEDGGGQRQVDFVHGAALVAAGDSEADAVGGEGVKGVGSREFDAGQAEDRSGD